MIAVLFGTFNAHHAANALLLEDLERAGIEVRVCHEPLWEETRDKHRPYFAPLGLLGLGLRYLGAAARLALRLRYVRPGAEVLIAGFNGQLDVLLLRLLARGRRVVFVPLVSLTETLVDDRATYAPGSVGARLLAWLDRRCLSAPDLVIIDTRAHRDYLTEHLGIPTARVAVQYLGAQDLFARAPSGVSAATQGAADAAPMAPVGQRSAGGIDVLAYSQYVPLHGNEVIAAAARALAPADGIRFELVGTGPERARLEPMLRELPHVRLTDWIDYAALPERLAAADVVLGIFGATEKARIVIPNKVYQAAFAGKAIVTADTPAIREVFAHGESAYLIEPRAEALRDALRTLARDRDLRARLGAGARAAAQRAAGPEVRARNLEAVLAAVVAT